MKVLIGSHIGFEENCVGESFAMIFGDYKVVEMSQENFENWSDTTNSDWITEEYEGDIYFCTRTTAKELFK
jgi:hypothetical protein